MQTSMKIVALMSIITGTFAADVYSVFFTEDNQKVGGVNYDVANNGCFENTGSTKVAFSQATANSFAEGPYCLTGFSDSGCSAVTGSQTFEHVPVVNDADDGQKILLDGGVSSGPFKKWALGSC